MNIDRKYLIPPLLAIDNMAALAISQNPKHHERSKHIDIKYHHIRDCVTRKQLVLSHVTSQENIADILTKSLPRYTHNRHMKAISME